MSKLVNAGGRLDRLPVRRRRRAPAAVPAAPVPVDAMAMTHPPLLQRMIVIVSGWIYASFNAASAPVIVLSVGFAASTSRRSWWAG